MRKTTKKLTLNHETVRTLTADQLDQAAGGVTITTVITCTCPPTKRLNCPSNPAACL